MEGLIYLYLAQDTQIASLLTTYHDEPAVFYQKSPNDEDDEWQKPCYPRIDYNVDKTADTERKTAGVLTVNIWVTAECVTATGMDPDKEIEERLKELLDGCFFSDEAGTICTVWNSTEAFSVTASQKNQEVSPVDVFGIEITFDLMEFLPQNTTEPDPIVGCNNWIKQKFPEARAIEHDQLPPVWKPTDTEPAVYWRFEGTEVTQESYTIIWYTGRFALHVIAETIPERNKWTKAISEALQLDGEILLEDGAPMFIKRCTIRHDSDPLRAGQINISGEYGVLAQQRKEKAAIRLNHAHFDKKEDKHHGKR